MFTEITINTFHQSLTNKTNNTMTIQQHAEKFGARATAQTLLNRRLGQFGLFTDDLPDTCEIADIIDQLEEAVEENDKEAIKDILSGIDLDWLGEIVMS